ncbi:glycosyltransferase family 2 protein [Gramella sp. AN32]|uniref:Glycosyltransferase family 2 protein n=1 Tax=Christiangramia antarctica TaxID=2058158 RepID=A0ABW5X3T9_9FLAO|nr:glycosyltransferase family 2 protein [Gramella sp. AN32]MCM4157917.1 hypothetical protein [Gramella sp. AN32]
MESELVSIIIPTYNRGEILPFTLQSVLKQTSSSWECLIVDDGSTDGTKHLIQQYLKDPRFIYIQRPTTRKKGAATCRNIGLENAKGNFIQYLDSDDTIAQNKIEVHSELLKNESPLCLATCKWGRFYVKSKKVVVHEKMPTYFSTNKPMELLNIFGNMSSYLPIHNYFIPIQLSNIAGKWNENLSNNDDGEYFTRIFLNCDKVKFTRRTHVLYRAGTSERISNLENRKNIQSYILGWKLIDEHLEIRGYPKHTTVKYAARNLFTKLKETVFKDLLTEHQLFFNKKRSLSEHLILKFFGKAKIWKPFRKFSA